MKNIFKVWDKVVQEFRHKHVFLFLNYDTALVSNVAFPSPECLSEGYRKLLSDLAASSFCRLGIISGRSLVDLKSRVGINNIVYMGNHGFEIESEHIRLKHDVELRTWKIFQ